MEIHLINDKINSYEFNQAVLHPTQTWEWNESLVKLGYEVIRIGEYKNNKLQNAFSIYFREIPYASFKIGYLSMSSYPSREVRQFLETIAKLKKCIVIKVKLATFTKNSRNKVETEKNNVLLHGTLIIDLKKNEHDLLADMKPKTRYNIHLAERKLVSVKEINNFDGLKIFYRLYLETCKRKRYQGQTCNYFQTLFETLSKSMFHIFIAFYKSVPLAANLVILFHDKIYVAYGGTSSRYRSVMAPHLLIWKIIQYGKKKKISMLDMAGISFNDPKIYNPRAGFTKFKVGFGGVKLQYEDNFDIVGDQNLYDKYSFEDIKLFPKGHTGLIIKRKQFI